MTRDELLMALSNIRQNVKLCAAQEQGCGGTLPAQTVVRNMIRICDFIVEDIDAILALN